MKTGDEVFDGMTCVIKKERVNFTLASPMSVKGRVLPKDSIISIQYVDYYAQFLESKDRSGIMTVKVSGSEEIVYDATPANSSSEVCLTV